MLSIVMRGPRFWPLETTFTGPQTFVLFSANNRFPTFVSKEQTSAIKLG